MSLPAETIDRIAELTVRGSPLIDGLDGRKMAVVPEGYTLHEVLPRDWPGPKLLRIAQSVVMHDLDSFIAYANRYKTEQTRFFAEPGFLNNGAARVTCVLDYHEAAEPHHGVHVATYAPRYSEQWKRWHQVCSAPLKQFDFAETVEEARADVSEPPAANLLDIISTFKATKKTDFDSLVYQRNGDTTLSYSEKTEEKGSMKMPSQLVLGIPVYFRGPAYAIPVLIKFRVGNGTVTFQLKLDRADVIEDHAFQVLTDKITEGTGIEVYLGKRA